MKKKLLAGLAVGVIMLSMTGVAEATSFTWITPGIVDILPASYPVRTEIGSIVAGYEVTEIEYALYGLPETSWQGITSGDTQGSHSVWLFGGNVSANFSTASTAIAFVAGGDHNDGNTNFYVDDILITTKNMYSFGGTLLVEGLDDIAHTVRVTGTTHLNGAVALAPTPTPIPGAVWLLGSGLAGLIGARRKKK